MHDLQGELKAIPPLKGRLAPLPTVQETHPREEIGEALVAEIDIKFANKVVKLLGARYPIDPTANLTHLRRFAKPGFLPEYVRKRFAGFDVEGEERGAGEGREQQQPPSSKIYILIPPPVLNRTELEAFLQPFIPSQRKETVKVAENDIEAEKPPATAPIVSVQIPLRPPISQDQASSWSQRLWPTTYNAAAHPASYAPPTQALNRTRESIKPHAGLYLSLAEKVAREARQLGRGRGVGVVVVDPSLITDDDDSDPLAAVVAVAGDARYWQSESDHNHTPNNYNILPPPPGQPYNPDTEGRPDHHALMRAVSMVSHRRLHTVTTSSSSPSRPSSPSTPSFSPSLTPPPTALESHFLCSPIRLLPPSSGGYLCTSLDIYSTHEPCLCCAMGMLLSRFRAVVVLRSAVRGERSRRGALDAEKGYGLHWREELNWRAMGFEFVEDNEGTEQGVGDRVEFHA